MMISVDGCIEGPNGELDWHRADEEYQEYANQTLRSVDGILLGRKVYDVFLNYWPNVYEELKESENSSLHFETARLLYELPEYVVSTTMKEASWNNTHIIRDNFRNEIKKLKEKPGRDIACYGGAELTKFLLIENLVDEYRLIVNPIILGDGSPLFKTDSPQSKLQFKSARKFQSGAVMLTYKPALT